MSYNDAWGGTIPFPEEEWDGWYDWWLARHDGDRFHRYLVDAEGGDFVGEVAYHYDESGRMHLAGVIVIASRRGRGREGLRLLCEAARERGVRVLWDSIAPDNPAIAPFLEQGFVGATEPTRPSTSARTCPGDSCGSLPPPRLGKPSAANAAAASSRSTQSAASASPISSCPTSSGTVHHGLPR